MQNYLQPYEGNDLTNLISRWCVKKVLNAGSSATSTNNCSSVTCLPPEYATRIVTRDSLSCSLVLRPQANPRGALLPTSGDKYIVPCSIISAWIQNKYKVVCTPVMKVTYKDKSKLENVTMKTIWTLKNLKMLKKTCNLLKLNHQSNQIFLTIIYCT